MILRPYQTIIATRSCNLLWHKLPPAESLPIKDSTVPRNGTVHIIVPLTDAEAASAEVFEYLGISGYCISSLAISKKMTFLNRRAHGFFPTAAVYFSDLSQFTDWFRR